MRKRILLPFILFFSGCFQKELKHIVSFYDTGEPENIFYYKNSSDSTTYRKEVYYKSGKLKQIGVFTKDLKDGEFIWFFENGKKSAKRTYRNGFFIDTGYSWYENGTIQKKIAIRKNLPQNDCEGCNGIIFDYDSSGFLKERYTLQNGMYEGVKIIYEKNGTWLQRTYKNDRLNGATKEFLINEEINDTTIVKGQYINDLEEGTWEFINLRKKSKEYRTYRQGKLNGERKLFDKKGTLRVKGIMQNDLMEGELFHYDSLGKLSIVEVFKKDKLVSKRKYD